MNVSEKIKTSRKKKGLTQQELARAANTTPQSIIRYEKGVRIPKMDMLESIAAALDMPVAYFLEDETDADSQMNSQIAVLATKTLKDPELQEIVKLLNTLNAQQLHAVRLILEALAQNLED